MTRNDIVRFFDERQHAWDARDADALGQAHAERGTVVSPMFATVVGRQAITNSYRSLFRMFTDWTFRGGSLLIDDARVAQPFTATATHTGEFMGLAPTGRRFEIEGIRLFDLGPDGEIVFEKRHYDFTGLLIQIGVLRSKTAHS
jgi:predicted ester cyclase